MDGHCSKFSQPPDWNRSPWCQLSLHAGFHQRKGTGVCLWQNKHLVGAGCSCQEECPYCQAMCTSLLLATMVWTLGERRHCQLEVCMLHDTTLMHNRCFASLTYHVALCLAGYCCTLIAESMFIAARRSGRSWAGAALFAICLTL